LAALIEKHGLSPHQYADVSSIDDYSSCSPSRVDVFSLKVSGCVNKRCPLVAVESTAT